MILKALADYYERMLNDPESDVAPPGWLWGKIDYAIVLDSNGNYKHIKSLQSNENGRKIGRTTLLPNIGKQALKHTNSGNDANLLWDNSSFVFGLGNKGEIKLKSFISTLEKNLGDLKDEAIHAILTFLRKGLLNRDEFAMILNHPEYGEDILSGRVSITFQLNSDPVNFIFNRKQIKDRISDLRDYGSDIPIGVCLATGKRNQPIELCHTVIKNLYGAKKDPNFTSFNNPAFISYGKKQSMNSPISKDTAFAYTTALNHLLRKNSRQRIQFGDATTVFWARKPDPIEDDFSFFIGDTQIGEENVSYAKIRSLLKSVRTGLPPEEDENTFYILGLTPIEARVAVRFWFEGSVKKIKEKIAQHFSDIQITLPRYSPEFMPIKRLLLATTRHSKTHPYGEEKDIQPQLGSGIIRAVLTGTSYPRSILQKTINRIKAEQGLSDKKGKQLENVTPARAALIKSFLVRDARLRGITAKEVGMALDKSNDNLGYLLGRLFAILEKIQKEANKPPELKKTIRDTYFSAATSNPLVAFKRLQDLSIHHLAKIRNSGHNTIWLDKLMQEVIDKIPASGIPAILSLEDQGRFAVGYYHQRQNFFNKKEENKKEGDNESTD